MSEKLWVAIYDTERGTGEASWMVRVIKRYGVQAETGHSPYFGNTSVLVKMVPTVKNLQKLRSVLKRQTGNDIDIDLIRSNIRRGLAT